MAQITHTALVAKIGSVGQAHRNLHHHMHIVAGHLPPPAPPVTPPAEPAPTQKGR